MPPQAMRHIVMSSDQRVVLRGVPQFVLDIDIGAGANQGFDALMKGILGRDTQRRIASRRQDIGIRARLKQPLDDYIAVLANRNIQRSNTVSTPPIDLSTMFEQKIDHLKMVLQNCIMYWRRAILRYNNNIGISTKVKQPRKYRWSAVVHGCHDGQRTT
ncbi:MAG: hypothetical protein BWY76_02570 [bacterium ADurb.Bin429]|nr:MAG: hypothetical protein BWY76_02570 [bacterium ADurb.Bin429]